MSEEQVQDETLNTLFDGEAEATNDVVEDEPTGDAEATEDEAKAKTEETEEAAPPAVEEPSDTEKQLKAQIAKSKDEKQKRQKLKLENEQLRQQIAQEQKPAAPDPFAEPDKALDHVKAELRGEFQQQFLNMSEQNAKARHTDDFDAMAELFFESMVADNPALSAEALAQVDPYEFIYRTAKNHSDMSQLTEAGGVDAFKSNLEKEIRAKIAAETLDKANQAVEDKITASIPGSLSNKRAAGGNKAVLQTEDTPLSKLF